MQRLFFFCAVTLGTFLHAQDSPWFIHQRDTFPRNVRAVTVQEQRQQINEAGTDTAWFDFLTTTKTFSPSGERVGLEIISNLGERSVYDSVWYDQQTGVRWSKGSSGRAYMTKTVFDKKGRRSEYWYMPKGKDTAVTFYEYDSKGHMTLAETRRGTKNARLEYSYNAKGDHEQTRIFTRRLVTDKWIKKSDTVFYYDKEKRISGYVFHEYDADGKISHQDSTYREYNAAGLKIKETQRAIGDSLSMVIQSEFDVQGKPQRVRIWQVEPGEDSLLFQTTTYTYDQYNFMESIHLVDLQNDQTFAWKTKYENGLPVECIFSVAGMEANRFTWTYQYW